MKNEVVILAFVVAVVVMLNFSLILVIESGKSDSVSQKVLRAVTGYNQLEIFSVQSFGEKEVSKKADSKKNVDTKVSSTSEVASSVSTSRTETTSPAIEQVQPIIDDVILPVPYAYYDYNDDGNLDLVRQEGDGKYYVYYNKGTSENKLYEEGTFIDESYIKSMNINFVMPSKVQEGSSREVTEWNYTSYPRFDLYIERNYYNNNSASLIAFFNNFAERYDLLEQQTNWSNEMFGGLKLRINVNGIPGICSGGSAYLGTSNLLLADPLYAPGCEKPYYVDGVPYLGNPGELGDWWPLMRGPLHESLHSINPTAIYLRLWLTEGFSQYNQYDILSINNDINQETADTYIYNGQSIFNWQGYVANDYRDTTQQNNPIQQSQAYDISAWMFSMMRDNHNLNWQNFYNIMNNNLETLGKSRQFGNYYIDTHVIDVFGRASGKTFDEIKAIWRYDGPSGPGWGVRNWTNLDWYADLNPDLIASKTSVSINENFTLTAKVYNNGNVSLVNIPLKIYIGGCKIIKETTINVSSFSYTNVAVNYSGRYSGVVNFVVRVDEGNFKIEKDKSNNQDSVSVGIGCYTYFDKKKWKWVNTCSPEMQSVYSCPNLNMA